MYYLAHISQVDDILEGGIQPGIETRLQNTPFGAMFAEHCIPLWKNLDIYEGKFFPLILEQGYELLSVELPEYHLVDRNLGLVSMMDGPTLGSMMLKMQIKIDPTVYINKP
jgi:hypothetical protein